MAFDLHSPAFRSGGAIPDKYGKDAQNLSPPLRWTGAPRETKSFALIVEDPDAPGQTFRHWAVWGMPAEQKELPENAGREDNGIRQAVNDFGETRYDGPKPPPGDGIHHYHFRLAALDTTDLGLGADANAATVWEHVRPHIIEEVEIVGTFQV